MKSRVHPTYKTKYHVQNWAAYDRALVRRGNITIWVSPAAVAAWEPDGSGTRGAQRKYSDLAIHTALTLRLLFHLPLRQAEGFLASLFVLMGLDLRSPDHTTLSRRGQHLAWTLRRVPTRAGLHLIIDSTGLSIVGQGEWAAAIHAVGSVNFLFDRKQRPHLTRDDLSALTGVPKSTIAKKAKLIRDVLHIRQMEPEFCRRELLASNPMAWMISIAGIIVDARSMSPEVQAEARRRGLIPDRPGRPANTDAGRRPTARSSDDEE